MSLAQPLWWKYQTQWYKVVEVAWGSEATTSGLGFKLPIGRLEGGKVLKKNPVVSGIFLAICFDLDFLTPPKKTKWIGLRVSVLGGSMIVMSHDCHSLQLFKLWKLIIARMVVKFIASGGTGWWGAWVCLFKEALWTLKALQLSLCINGPTVPERDGSCP